MTHEDLPSHDPTNRQGRISANLARHLNSQYPDTVLFLARYASGRPEATAAQLAKVLEDSVMLIVEADRGLDTVTLALPPLPMGKDSGGARERLRVLILETRAALPAQPAVPITSLEASFLSGDEGAGGHARPQVLGSARHAHKRPEG
jgi:hypothetical protein